MQNLLKEYKETFNEEFDLYGLNWNNPAKRFDLIIECLDKKKRFSEILSKETLELISEALIQKILGMNQYLGVNRHEI